jgi:transcriptional regulator of met regulon
MDVRTGQRRGRVKSPNKALTYKENGKKAEDLKKLKVLIKVIKICLNKGKIKI